ncbi:MAG: sulfate reduction electron transfer complex DsrMKJOP subunit DsrJ [Gemmatimonadota bacterium]|jgi:hypothetical protein
MRDRTFIAVGLGLVLVLGAYPVWNGLRAEGEEGRPTLERASDPSGCVEDTLFMRANHQELLNEWRTAVVRDGEVHYTSTSGRQFEMSLTGTCLGCHESQEAFCGRCHTWADVEPTCWNCHVAPEGG